MKVLGEDKVIGRDVTVEEMIEEVEKDRPYYWRSGGGLTLSGGESLCQPEFARDLLRAAKERGINTALESMACAPFETIETILTVSGSVSDGYQTHQSGKTQRIYRQTE